MAVGGKTSSTVTVASHVEIKPFTSVTVNVTVLVPMFEQSNAVGETLRLSIAQLSELPLSTSAATILAFPFPSSCTVIS